MKEDERDQSVDRVTKLLKAAVQFLGVSHRQIERSMGLSTGYLSRIFSGKVVLRMEHVLGICDAIGLPAGAFFEAAFPSREHDRRTARLVAALQELMPESESGDEVQRRSTDAILRHFSRLPEAAERKRGLSLRRAALASQILELVLASMDEQEPGWDER